MASAVRSSWPALVLLLTVAVHADPDPRICAIHKQGREQLLAISQKASIEHDADADDETLRALLYQKMQGEIPGNSNIRPWPTPSERSDCDSFNQKQQAAQQTRQQQQPQAQQQGAVPDMSKMAEMIFRKLDRNADGKLTSEEMKAMLDEVNAAAKAKGEAEYDLFASLDRDKDGFVRPEEANEFFKTVAAGAAGGATKTPAPPKPKSTSPQDEAAKVAASLFDNMDKDKDSKLSKEEYVCHCMCMRLMCMCMAVGLHVLTCALGLANVRLA